MRGKQTRPSYAQKQTLVKTLSQTTLEPKWLRTTSSRINPPRQRRINFYRQKIRRGGLAYPRFPQTPLRGPGQREPWAHALYREPGFSIGFSTFLILGLVGFNFDYLVQCWAILASSWSVLGPSWGQLGLSWGHLGPRLAGLLAGSPEPYLRKVVKTLGTSFSFRILPLCRFILPLILSIFIHLIPFLTHLSSS